MHTHGNKELLSHAAGQAGSCSRELAQLPPCLLFPPVLQTNIFFFNDFDILKLVSLDQQQYVALRRCLDIRK